MGINYNKIPASNKKWVGGIMCLYLSLNERAMCRILKNIRNFVADTIVRVNSIPKEMTVLMADTVRYVSGKGGGSIQYNCRGHHQSA